MRAHACLQKAQQFHFSRNRTEPSLCIYKKNVSVLWNYCKPCLIRFTSTNFDRNKILSSSFKDKHIAQSPCTPKWLRCLGHYFILLHLTFNICENTEVSNSESLSSKQLTKMHYQPISVHCCSIFWTVIFKRSVSYWKSILCYVITLNKD